MPGSIHTRLYHAHGSSHHQSYKQLPPCLTSWLAPLLYTPSAHGTRLKAVWSRITNKLHERNGVLKAIVHESSIWHHWTGTRWCRYIFNSNSFFTGTSDHLSIPDNLMGISPYSDLSSPQSPIDDIFSWQLRPFCPQQSDTARNNCCTVYEGQGPRNSWTSGRSRRKKKLSALWCCDHESSERKPSRSNMRSKSLISQQESRTQIHTGDFTNSERRPG